MTISTTPDTNVYRDSDVARSSALSPGSSPLPSPSQLADTGSKHNDSITTSYLDVPRYARTSLDSAFSDYSELSIHSGELQSHHLLHRQRSHSPYKHNTNLTYRSRIVAALHSFYVANYGAFLVLVSQGFGSLMNIATRLLETPGTHGAPMHPFQILFARQSITAALCTIFALTTKSIPDFPLGPKGTVRWLLVARGLCGFFGVFGLYFSLLYLPLSEATVLTFLTPILTCYACTFLIPGETFSRQQQLAALVSLIGVVFIAQPASLFKSQSTNTSQNDNSNSTLGLDIDGVMIDNNNSTGSSLSHPQITTPTPSEHLLAIGIAMIGVLGATVAITCIRSIGTRAHPFLSVNYFSVWCTIVSLLGLIFIPAVKFRLPGNALEWGLLFMIGFCGFVMQFLLTSGLAYGGPSKNSVKLASRPDLENSTNNTDVSAHRRPSGVSRKADADSKLKKGSGTRATSMLYTQMLFALMGDKFVFGVSPGMMSWVGSGLILAGAIWVAAAKDGKAPPPATSSVSTSDRNDHVSGVGDARDSEETEQPKTARSQTERRNSSIMATLSSATMAGDDAVTGVVISGGGGSGWETRSNDSERRKDGSTNEDGRREERSRLLNAEDVTDDDDINNVDNEPGDAVELEDLKHRS